MKKIKKYSKGRLSTFFFYDIIDEVMKMKKGDYIIIISILLIVILSYAFVVYMDASAETKVLEIKQGEKISRYTLEPSYENRIKIEEDDKYNIIDIKDGFVWVHDSNCKSRVCVNHKKISKVGETIICIPHKLVIEIKGEKKDVDIIVE